MKRFLVLCLIVVVIWSAVSVAFGSGVNLLTVMGARISSGISSSANTVTGKVIVSRLPGETVRIYVYLQAKSPTGSWTTKTSASGDGSTTIPVTCSAVSGYSYRVKYTYKWYDDSNSLLESGSGYSNVIQVP